MIAVEEKLNQLERFAVETFTPVIRADSWRILERELLARQPRSILEIGTAIGYSAIKILNLLPHARLTSLEIRKCRHAQAISHLTDVGMIDRAELLEEDALTYLSQCDRRFDCVFLDGPKAQYSKYLPFISRVLNRGGWIFSDNLSFGGRVDAVRASGLDAINRKHRAAVKGLIEFSGMISSPPFSSVFYEEGDGTAVTVKTYED